MSRTPSTFVISITPFTADLALDEGGLRAHLRRMAAAGIGVYVGGGGSGEGYTLSADEHHRVLEIAVDELKGRVPVRAMGVEPRTPAEMVAYARLAAKAGMDAVQVYSLDMGHGMSPKPRELAAYYDEVLDGLEVPAVISTHQSVGYFIPETLLADLAGRYPQVVGVNCTSPDVTYLSRLIDLLPSRVDVHVGGPMQALTALALGASGYLSSDANVAPALAASVVEAWSAEAFGAAHDDFATLIRLFGVLTRGGGISATKAVLTGLGLPGGVPRPPRLPIDDPDEVRRLVQAVRDLGIPELQQL